MNYDNQDPDNGEDDRKRDSSRKREGKREKKEKGYQMFEEDDSEEERLMLAEDMKSPSKQKKERVKPTFKFPVRKEKAKDKDEKKDKEAKREEKEKKRGEKEGKKLKKEKKKSKHAPAPVMVSPSQYETPIFGVPLAVAVERNKSHDGIELPAIVRECIDYMEECGLACEGIYRISGVKSKVQHLKDCYNRHEPVYLCEHEPNVVASLLKQFLRDLPEPVLTTALMPKFEEASVIKNSKKKSESFMRLISDLPTCNRLLLSWMIVHMTHVIDLAKENKMTLQNVSIVLSPTMQISHRVLNILFSNVDTLFAGFTLRKYVPPLKPAHSKWSLELPDNPVALEEELAKQESLLNQLHSDLNSGLTDPEIEEQLWEVQRVVTQLKRKIKMAKKNQEMTERRKTNLESKKSSTASLPSLSAPEELHTQLRSAPEEGMTVTAVVEKEASPSSEKKGVRFVEEPDPQTQEGEVGAEASNDEGPEDKDSAIKEPTSEKEEHKEQQLGKCDEEKQENKTEQAAEPSSQDVTAGKDKETSGKAKETTEKDKDATDSHKEMTEKDKEPETAVKERKEEKSSNETQQDDEGKESSGGDADQKPPSENKEIPEETKSHKKTKAPEAPPQNAEKVRQPPPQNAEKVWQAPPLNAEKAQQAPPQSAEKARQALPQNVEKTPQAPPQSAEKARQEPPQNAETAPSHPEESRGRKASLPEQKVQLEQAPVVTRPPELKKAVSIPPFMSTDVLQPTKAEPPRAKPVRVEVQDDDENVRQSEKLRELEEELLGEKKKKVAAPKEEEEEQDEETDEETDEALDQMDIDQLLEEEYAAGLEEEELLAIADELHQKIATERSEMERLSQEIQELQYLRQDSDLEDLSSSSSSSEDSEDEEDLQTYLCQLIQDNQELETKNADLCQKIHEERMICLSVKLQIRLLQQKQLEASYG